MACDDFDLCLPCHIGAKHGHHPAHSFKPTTSETQVGPLAHFLCAAGRNVRHSALCDGCDKYIYGVRHKCLNCPDWDYCSECIKSARFNHPMHRFVPIYEPIAESRITNQRHYGIYCDGPLCKDKATPSYVEGVRYKCAICNDVDFCANCEASPRNKHNRTHPLIKFKTPVRNVSVTTMGEDKHGASMRTMGDSCRRRSTATETAPLAPATNAATQIKTIVDLKPAEAAPKPLKEKIQIKDLLAEPIQEKVKIEDLLSTPVKEEVKPVEAPNYAFMAAPTSELNAHFVRDLVADGSRMTSDQRFVQIWTLRNPGPHAWPAGCSVRYAGGDSMLNVDHTHPSSATDLAEATESNVIGRTVEVGEEIAFRVTLKAPKREGTSISYWRLKAVDGMPFGHRLWCHIDVVAAEPSPLPSASQPIAIAAAPSAAAVVVVAPAASDPFPPTTQPLRTLSAQQDYQMQLMLLEQQNKRRLLMVRQEGAREAEKKKQAAASEAAEAAAKRASVLQQLEAELKAMTVSEQKKAEQAETAAAAKQPTVEDEKPEDEEEATDHEHELKTKGSRMIFPRLEKENPTSSTHEAVTNASLSSTIQVAPSERAVNTDTSSSAASTVAAAATLGSDAVSTRDLDFEDGDSVEVVSASSSDDGEDEETFFTDEEYDILDADDEEELA